jgi:ribosomal protein L28
MANTCTVCGKGSVIRGKRRLLRGHYNPVSTARKYPNLQWAKVGAVRKFICTNCMKTLHKTRKAKK